MTPDKYIATIESMHHKNELVCLLGKDEFQQLGTLEEVAAFKRKEEEMFPESPVRIYRLEEVKGARTS